MQTHVLTIIYWTQQCLNLYFCNYIFQCSPFRFSDFPSSMSLRFFRNRIASGLYFGSARKNTKASNLKTVSSNTCHSKTYLYPTQKQLNSFPQNHFGKLLKTTPTTRVYGRYIKVVHGGYKPTNNTGEAPPFTLIFADQYQIRSQHMMVIKLCNIINHLIFPHWILSMTTSIDIQYIEFHGFPLGKLSTNDVNSIPSGGFSKYFLSRPLSGTLFLTVSKDFCLSQMSHPGLTRHEQSRKLRLTEKGINHLGRSHHTFANKTDVFSNFGGIA